MIMKKMNKVLVALVLAISPALLHAHPGHNHSADWMSTFLHYLATYYILLVPVVLVMLVVFNLGTIKRLLKKVQA
jgi:hypothetical protein